MPAQCNCAGLIKLSCWSMGRTSCATEMGHGAKLYSTNSPLIRSLNDHDILRKRKNLLTVLDTFRKNSLEIGLTQALRFFHRRRLKSNRLLVFEKQVLNNLAGGDGVHRHWQTVITNHDWALQPITGILASARTEETRVGHDFGENVFFGLGGFCLGCDLVFHLMNCHDDRDWGLGL